MSSNITLGQIITGNEGRDAVHVAIAPCVAKEKLFPGQDVGADGTTAQPHVGIVDPYLKHPVLPDQGFWVCLYPNTITSLRHEWLHPEFDKNADGARAWLEGFAGQAGITYDELIEAAHDYLDRGEYLSQGGRWEGFWTPDEFWPHFEAVTGRKVQEEDRGSFFSCAC